MKPYLFLNAIIANFFKDLITCALNFNNEQIIQKMSQKSNCIFDSRSIKLLQVVVESQNQLEEIYDQITYQKSSSINRMLYYYLGEEIFQKGISLFWCYLIIFLANAINSFRTSHIPQKIPTFKCTNKRFVGLIKRRIEASKACFTIIYLIK